MLYIFLRMVNISQHGEKHVIQTPFSIRVGKYRFFKMSEQGHFEI
jgi:hypothetical protein